MSQGLEEVQVEEILGHFDRLVAGGLMFYDPEPVIINHIDNDVEFEFRITNAILNKPSIPSGAQARDTPAGAQPGSDINVSGLEIATVADTHVLTFNLFSAFRPHFLILTLDTSCKQYHPLRLSDFQASHNVLSSLGAGYLALYNCGVKSGCSRYHKHLQVVPRPEADAEHKADYDPWGRITAGEQLHLPFVAFYHSFGDKTPSAVEQHAVYCELLQEAGKALGKPTTSDGTAPPHNAIYDGSGMMVIPRRAAGIGGAGMNAAGMLGLIWVSDDEKLKKYMDIGPSKVLHAAGVPKKIENQHTPKNPPQSI